MYPTPYPTGMTLFESLHYIDPATLIGPADNKGHLNVHYAGKLEARHAPSANNSPAAPATPRPTATPPITPKAPSFLKQVQKFMKEQS